MPDINIPVPKLQIVFSSLLEEMRSLYLQDALRATVETMEIAVLDKQLAEFVPGQRLAELAGRGLRGELVYAAPCLLEKNPRLLGYYRLLLGFSQKEFYTKLFGVSGFKSMESSGRLSPDSRARLENLCRGLNASAAALVDGIGVGRLSRELLDDLALLTVGPQLRGGTNVKIGLRGIEEVFKAISNIVQHTTVSVSGGKIEIVNAAGRTVFIQFAPDPDIVIREQMSGGSFHNLVAIEIKGGKDFSNIHNRIGEAEKSHQKAKAAGYVECWTVVNVDRIDMDMAKRESPTTNRFYRLSSLTAGNSAEYRDFEERIVAATRIKESKKKKAKAT
ncbi:MAG: XcyI family restriction endonuclease [Humidesulfovibrio sp.]|nr:XcyI family restriction endonuclease [Humidesulfovibrio sp.]